MFAPAPVASPAHAAVAAGVARQDADGSVVFAPPVGSDYAAPTVQRELEPNQDEGRRADVQAPTPPAGAAPSPLAGLDTADLEDLARRLFDPLAARLRTELWLDRERAGFLTDPRY